MTLVPLCVSAVGAGGRCGRACDAPPAACLLPAPSRSPCPASRAVGRLGNERAAWCGEGSTGWGGKRGFSYSDFWEDLEPPSNPASHVQVSSRMVGLVWEMTMGEESFTPCSVLGTSPQQTSAGSCLVLAVTLRAVSVPLGRENPSALAPPGPAVATRAGSEPTACAHWSCLLVDEKGPCETN